MLKMLYIPSFVYCHVQQAAKINSTKPLTRRSLHPLATCIRTVSCADPLLRYTDEVAPPKSAAPEVELKAEPAQEVVKAEESHDQTEPNGQGGEETYNGGDQDMDDEIDFNLGQSNGNSNNYDAPATHEAHGPGIKEDG